VGFTDSLGSENVKNTPRVGFENLERGSTPTRVLNFTHLIVAQFSHAAISVYCVTIKNHNFVEFTNKKFFIPLRILKHWRNAADHQGPPYNWHG